MFSFSVCTMTDAVDTIATVPVTVVVAVVYTGFEDTLNSTKILLEYGWYNWKVLSYCLRVCPCCTIFNPVFVRDKTIALTPGLEE